MDAGRLRGERDVRAVAASQTRAETLFAGVESEPGTTVLLRSDDHGDTFDAVGESLVGRDVWALATSPFDPDVLYAGTRPAQLLRSDDGGLTWSDLELGADLECRIGPTRVTSVVVGAHPDEVWVGIEIGGIFHSSDAGESWTHHLLTGGEALLDADEEWIDERHADIHSLAWTRSGELVVATPIGFFRTPDRGGSWSSTRFGHAGRFDRLLYYTRSVMADPRDGALFAGVGVKPPNHGLRGGVNRSIDGGVTWEPVSPVLRSVVWGMARSPFVPDVLAGVCLNGQIVISGDGGKVWEPAEREFGETRAIAVTTSGRD